MNHFLAVSAHCSSLVMPVRAERSEPGKDSGKESGGTVAKHLFKA
jgi:hypothetical protein